jgi:polyphenol oxidase
MRIDERDGLAAYRFDMLSGQGVDALISTRPGGVSTDPYTSLNLGLGVGDEEEAVLANRRRLFATYGLPLNRSVWSRQVHSDRIAIVGTADAGSGALDASTAIDATDALVTAAVDVPLCVTVADCVPIAIHDPKLAVIALVHAGWGGTVLRIASQTVEEMRSRFGSDTADLIVGIGPSIGPDRYEVGADVIAGVRESYGARADELLRPRGDGKALLDLWTANRLDLESAGVEPAKIEVAGISTADTPDRLYSYRAESRTGRLAAVICLTDRG